MGVMDSSGTVIKNKKIRRISNKEYPIVKERDKNQKPLIYAIAL